MTALDLRPLSLGELLDRTFFIYRRHFFMFTGIAAIPYSLFFVVSLSSVLFKAIRLRSPQIIGHMPSGGYALMAGGGVIAVLLLLAGSVAFLFSVGATVFAVSEIYLGHQTSIGASLRRVRHHTVTIMGVLFLSGVIAGGGLILLVVPGIYLACRVSIATAAALLENTGATQGIRRSFELTRNFAGRPFMIYLLYFALVWGVVALLQMPFLFLTALYAKQLQLTTIFSILSEVGSFLGKVLVTPVSTIGFAVFYYDLRVRKEAFDLQMMMQAISDAPVPPPLTGGLPSISGPDAT